MAMANGARALGEAFARRFVLGIGVSHAPSVATRGGDYGSPLQRMRAYLDALDAAQYAAPAPEPPVPLVLAALGPADARAGRRARGRRPSLLRPRRAHGFRSATSGPRSRAGRGAGGGSYYRSISWPGNRACVRRALPRAAELRQQPAVAWVGRTKTSPAAAATH